MEKIEHVRDFRETDILILAEHIILLASCGELGQTPEYIDFKTIDVATVLGAILKVISENTEDSIMDDVVELLYISQKTVKRSVDL